MCFPIFFVNMLWKWLAFSVHFEFIFVPARFCIWPFHVNLYFISFCFQKHLLTFSLLIELWVYGEFGGCFFVCDIDNQFMQRDVQKKTEKTNEDGTYKKWGIRFFRDYQE